jgi:hypothetical protein
MELTIKTVTDIIKGDNYFLNNTMTPKEKAKELVGKFYKSQVEVLAKDGTAPLDLIEHEISVKSALIAVDEMIVQNGELYLQGLALDYYKEKNAFLFAVKQEIEKL